MWFTVTKKDAYDCYACRRHTEAMKAGVPSPCVGTSYVRRMLEKAVILSLTELAERPASVKAQLVRYRAAEQGKDGRPLGSREDARREMANLDKALAELAAEDTLTVQAQIAGLRMGASPNVYAAVFADLSARRKDMEERRGTLRRQMDKATEPGKVKGGRPSDEVLRLQGLSDLRRVLTSEEVEAQSGTSSAR